MTSHTIATDENALNILAKSLKLAEGNLAAYARSNDEVKDKKLLGTINESIQLCLAEVLMLTSGDNLLVIKAYEECRAKVDQIRARIQALPVFLQHPPEYLIHGATSGARP